MFIRNAATKSNRVININALVNPQAGHGKSNSNTEMQASETGVMRTMRITATPIPYANMIFLLFLLL